MVRYFSTPGYSINYSFVICRRRKFERDLLCDGFFVNYDEIINHSVYHAKSGSMFASKVRFLSFLVHILINVAFGYVVLVWKRGVIQWTCNDLGKLACVPDHSKTLGLEHRLRHTCKTQAICLSCEDISL